jgi:hypothetical protein
MRVSRQQSRKDHRDVSPRGEHSTQRWGGQKPIITGPLGAAKQRNTLVEKLAAKPKRAA